MTSRWRTHSVIASCFIVSSVLGQSPDSLSVEQQLLQLELEMDSISLFGFLDSLLLSTSPKSEASIRFAYSSSRLTAGRDFNLNLRGYMPGIAYYHKTGFYADYTVYIDPNFSPNAYQSIVHFGHMWTPSNKWMINPYVEKVFFHIPSSTSLDKSIGTSLTYDFKLAEASVDYALLWGNDTGHRLIPGLSKTIRISNVPLVKNIRLYPGVSLLAGTTSIFTYQYTNSQIDEYLVSIQNLTDEEIRFLVLTRRITTAEAIQLRLTRRLLNEGSEADISELKSLLNGLVETSAFQLLNVSVNLPVAFDVGNTSLMISYSYSIPQRVRGEDLAIRPSGFFGITISRRFAFNSN